MKKTKISKQPLAGQLHDPAISVLTRYRLKVLGDESFFRFFMYELTNFLFGNMPGGAGYVLRKWALKKLLKRSGPGFIPGRGVSFRHPGKISMGDRVAIDDYCLIDASGAGSHGIVMEDDVIISRNCVIQVKTGPVLIGKRTDIGCNTIISSAAGISIGNSVLIAGNCYIGGARYNIEKKHVPVMDPNRPGGRCPVQNRHGPDSVPFANAAREPDRAPQQWPRACRRACRAPP
jgi:acetyltransferase-like isoleucine patch superfamily enzyme